ncbi:ClpP/crotonase-like domain-containing protein [Sporodiniella umbellata]|nr:ClpP/crotonase-like domain-containing protein [Sporodiniella umbellata]
MDLSSSMGQENKDESFARGIEVFEALYHYPKPVIARVNGPCLGGGVGLVFTTDFRAVHQNAYFALTEVKRGLIPAIISKYIVPELGAQKSKEYMLTGRRVLPEELKSSMSALAASENELDDKVQQLARELLESAPGAMATIKRLVHTIDGDRERSQYAQKEIKKVFLDMVQSEEAAYGIQCFFTKQKPDWSTLHSKL